MLHSSILPTPVAHPFHLTIPQRQVIRMAETCFRGEEKAGAFRIWKSPKDVVGDERVKTKLVAAIQAFLSGKPEPCTHRIMIEHETWVGWASTVPLSDLPQNVVLREFGPNANTRAMLVEDKSVPAPKTKLITFVCEVRQSLGAWDFVVHSLYPGQNVPLGVHGKPRTIPPMEAVFFGWENPGA